MLAAPDRELPVGRYLYEPKWTGLRCLAFVERGEVDLRSRHGKPLVRYFPELTAALAALGRDFVLDGEIVIVGEHGFDFAALLNRTHPAASRVARLSRETPRPSSRSICWRSAARRSGRSPSGGVPARAGAGR